MSDAQEYWLSLDLSSPQGSLAIHRFEHGIVNLVAALDLADGGHHSESLIDAVQEGLARTSLPLRAIHRFLTPSGPGSFTGLRIAFSALKAFASVTRASLEVLDAHEVRALHFLRSKPAINRDCIAVSTRLTRDSFLVSDFRIDAAEVFETQRTIRTQPNIEDGDLTDQPDKGICYPLHAVYLAETLLTAKTRQCHATPGSQIAACPEYYGSRNY